MKIKKVLNSSVVLAFDKQGKEFVCLGKGIGYGKKSGASVEKNAVDQIYMPVEDIKSKQFLNLFESIPSIYFDITQKIVLKAKKELGSKLNLSIYFTLSDHLNFAVERMKNNINITNRVYWEIKNYYPDEFQIGVYSLDLVNQIMDVELPKEEAANIAFHIINAKSKSDDSGFSMKCAKLTGGIVNLLRYSISGELNTESVHYQRFITHVKFFAERFFKNEMLNQEDEVMFENIATLHPDAMDIAFKVKDYVEKVYDSVISKDELTYLAVHIYRLRSYNALN